MSLETTPFVIVSQARSGSTMLGSALERHPQVLMHGEIFGAHHYPLNVYGIDENLTWPTPLEIFLKKMRDKDINRFLAEIIFADTGRRAVGFKFKFEEFPAWPGVVEFIKSQGIRIVYMRRLNLFDRHLSEVESDATGYFNTTDKMKFSLMHEDEIRRKLEIATVKSAIEKSLAYDALFAETFTNNEILPVTYEQCVQNWNAASLELCKFLDLDTIELHPSSEKRETSRRIGSMCEVKLLRSELCSAGYAASCGE